jgi:hypothetical protein
MVSMGAWMWIGEHEQVNKTKSFLEYFVNIEGISKEYSLTWHIIYHDIEEYFATCTWMNDNYGWKKLGEKWNGWKIKMDEHNLFTTKSYVRM